MIREKEYNDLLKLPIKTDFKNSAPRGFEKAWGSLQSDEGGLFGPFDSAAYLRIETAQNVVERLGVLADSDCITSGMKSHIGALRIENVFTVEQFLSFVFGVAAKSENTVPSPDGFNAALKSYDLPLMGKA